MRVAFPETRKDPQTETAAYDMMRQVNDFMVESSYGNIYLLSTITPLLVMPRTEAWYNGGGGDEFDLRADAQNVARALGYDTNQYDLDIIVYSGGPGSFGGLGYVGGKGVWLKSIIDRRGGARARAQLWAVARQLLEHQRQVRDRRRLEHGIRQHL